MLWENRRALRISRGAALQEPSLIPHKSGSGNGEAAPRKARLGRSSGDAGRDERVILPTLSKLPGKV